MVIKLLMNSMYGKTITKPIETDTVVKDNRNDFEKFMSYGYNYIESVLKVDDRYYIKTVKSFLSHDNYVHCGFEILSMSKNIMNFVFDCANDCNVKTYYQDAGSIHLNYDDVDKMGKWYKEKYKLYLAGENLCRFHVDWQQKRYKEVYFIEGLFLGKNSFFYLSEYVDGNDKEHEIHDDLARMKSFPTSCIEYHAIIKCQYYVDVYKDLYDNGSIEIDLTNQSTKCVWGNTPEFDIKSWFYGDKGIKGTCRFIRDEDDQIFIN